MGTTEMPVEFGSGQEQYGPNQPGYELDWPRVNGDGGDWDVVDAEDVLDMGRVANNGISEVTEEEMQEQGGYEQLMAIMYEAENPGKHYNPQPACYVDDSPYTGDFVETRNRETWDPPQQRKTSYYGKTPSFKSTEEDARRSSQVLRQMESDAHARRQAQRMVAVREQQRRAISGHETPRLPEPRPEPVGIIGWVKHLLTGGR